MAKRLLEGLRGIRLALDGEETRGEQFQPTLRIGFVERSPGVGQDLFDDRSCVDIFGRTCEFVEIVAVEARQRPNRRGDGFGRFAGIEAELREQGREFAVLLLELGNEQAKAVALRHDLAEQRLEAAFARPVEDAGEGCRQAWVFRDRRPGDHRPARFGDQRPLHLLVEHLEMAGNVRLERKLMEDRFAECVDGLDLQAARRLQRLGKQPPRPPQPFRAGPLAFQLLDVRGEIGVGAHCPCRQGRRRRASPCSPPRRACR